MIRLGVNLAAVLSLLSVLSSPLTGRGETFPNGVEFNCYPSQYQGQNAASCMIGFSVFSFVKANYDTQHEPEWCWAASLEMALTAEHHKVPQEQIVTIAYGAPVDWSAGVQTIEDVANALTKDQDGNDIVVTLKDWANDDSSQQIHKIVGSLSRGHPVLLALPTHVVVLTALSYFGTGEDLQEYVFTNGRVQDPWPAGYMGSPGGSRVMGQSEYATVQHVWEVNVF